MFYCLAWQGHTISMHFVEDLGSTPGKPAAYKHHDVDRIRGISEIYSGSFKDHILSTILAAYVWATCNQSRAHVGYGGLFFWAAWLSRGG